MADASLDYLFKCLKTLVNHQAQHLIVPVKDQVETLLLDFIFLRSFLRYTANWCSEPNEYSALSSYLTVVAEKAGFSIYLFCVEQTDECRVKELNCALAHLAKISMLIEPGVRKNYINVSKSLQSELPIADGLLVGFVESILKKLSMLLNGSSNFIALLKDKLEAVQEELKVLRIFLICAASWRIEGEAAKDLLKHIESAVIEAGSVPYLRLVSEVDESMAKEINRALYELLEKWRLIKAEIRGIYSVVPMLLHSEALCTDELVIYFNLLPNNLTEVVRGADLTASMRDLLETLQEGLKYIVVFLLSPQEQYIGHENLDTLMTSIKSVASEAVYAIYLLFVGKMYEITAWAMNGVLSHLIQKIKLIKSEIRELYLQVLKPLRSNIPKADVLGFVNFLQGNLKELLNHRVDLILPVKGQIETIQGGLAVLRSFLKDMTEHNTEHEKLKDLVTRIRAAAYEAECIIDLFVVRAGPVGCLNLWIFDVVEEFKLISASVTEIYDKKTYGIGVQEVAKISRHETSRANVPKIDEVVVGFVDQAVAIMDRLTGIPMHLEVISIVGMAGLGKTTLAKKVFNDSYVAYHFYVRAWCCVSQVYERRQLLLDILNSVVELTDRIYKLSDEDLAEVLYKGLKGKRYLIVLDDLWNVDAWNDLRRSFPNDKNGSRIMLTSRLHDVVSQAIPHHLRSFSNEESWELLKVKVFGRESCPPDLVEVGKRIAENCRGLPLAVVVIAGILAKTEKRQNFWEKVEQSINSLIGDTKQCMDILELSYTHLPDHLKSCFLYLGAFLEDREIPVSKLKWLWIAEGFVQKTDLKSLEDVAESYLMDLISRSLVIVAKTRSKGGVKTCHIHDLLRDLCLAKAKEENFLQKVFDLGNFPPPSSYDFLDYSIQPDDCYSSTPTTFEQYRLCLYAKRRHLILSRPSGPFVRSLLFFADKDMNPAWSYDMTFLCHDFKLLRVLDVGCINMGDSFPSGIELLAHLRYLSVRGEMNSVPSWIASLWNLEIFIVKGLREEVVMPDTIWKMVRLRHVQISGRASFGLHNYKPEFFESSSLLENLETISTPSLFYEEKLENIMRRLPSLRKLKCVFSEPWNYSMNCNQFPVLNFLSQLESLKVFNYGKVLYPCEFNFPKNLKKLTLSKFRLPWKEISKIGKSLPNLQVLKLLSRAFEGQKWDTREGEFLNLKFLKLDALNIAQWNTSNDHFPHLQRLVLHRCKQLEKIPSSLGDISPLELIEVKWCSQSTVESAMQILLEQQDMGNEALKVLI